MKYSLLAFITAIMLISSAIEQPAYAEENGIMHRFKNWFDRDDDKSKNMQSKNKAGGAHNMSQDRIMKKQEKMENKENEMNERMMKKKERMEEKENKMDERMMEKKERMEEKENKMEEKMMEQQEKMENKIEKEAPESKNTQPYETGIL